jgi:hypothetical protein
MKNLKIFKKPGAKIKLCAIALTATIALSVSGCSQELYHPSDISSSVNYDISLVNDEQKIVHDDLISFVLFVDAQYLALDNLFVYYGFPTGAELFYLNEPGVGVSLITGESYNFDSVESFSFEGSFMGSRRHIYGNISGGTNPHTPNDTFYLDGNNTMPFRALIDPSDLKPITDYNDKILSDKLVRVKEALQNGKFGVAVSNYVGQKYRWDWASIFVPVESIEDLCESSKTRLYYNQGDSGEKQYLTTMINDSEFYSLLESGACSRNITKEQALDLFYQYEGTFEKVRKLKP